MRKPIGITLILGLLALAFAAMPAFASAAEGPAVLTEPEGTLVEVGETALGTQDEANPILTHTALGTLECEEITLNGEVTSNPPAAVTGTGTTANCVVQTEVFGPVPINVNGIAFSDVFNEDTTDSAEFVFDYEIPAFAANCFLQTTEATGPALTTWENESNTVEIDPSPLEGGGNSGFCAASGEIEGAFVLETEDGTPVLVSHLEE